MLEIINRDKEFTRTTLDGDINSETSFQQLVPAGCWQRAYITGSYSLVGCTVSPAFDFNDFEMLEADELAEQFPDMSSQICYDPFS